MVRQKKKQKGQNLEIAFRSMKKGLGGNFGVAGGSQGDSLGDSLGGSPWGDTYRG